MEDKCQNGKYKVKGKCINKYRNPFKMWGSYVGAFLGLITPTLFFYYLVSKCTLDCGMLGIAFFPLQIYGLITIPVGFLIGWGIHSLIRSIKK